MMAILKRATRSKRGESLSGRFMVDTHRGSIRVRKWPEKRGTPTSLSQLWWIDWFRQANRLAKYVDGATAARAIQLTKGSGMYPRDIILSAMRGRLYSWYDSNGKKWRSMAAIQDISDSLDILAQDVGSLLIRYADRWRTAEPGNVNDVLAYKGVDIPPAWTTPSAGGVVTGLAPGTPITVDNTTNKYDIDVSGFASVIINMDDIVFSAADGAYFRLSTDGGSTFKAGATDYQGFGLQPASDYNGQRSTLVFADTNVTTVTNGTATFHNLRAGRCSMQNMCAVAASARQNAGFARFAGPITHIQILTGTGSNFKTGTIRASGYAAA